MWAITWLLLASVPAPAVAPPVATPAPACAIERIRDPAKTAWDAWAKRDLAATKAAIDPLTSCPVDNNIAYLARVIRADVAVKEGDWATARRMLEGVAVHPEQPLSPLAGAIRLRTDSALNDDAAFARDRQALIIASGTALAGLGRIVESFDLPGAKVLATEAVVRQGPFRRVIEFSILPANPRAYPQSVLVTEDSSAAQLMGGTHGWFIDHYRCGVHATIAMEATAGTKPAFTYAAAKAAVIKALEKETFPAETIADREVCGGMPWILPGLGATAGGK